MLNLHYAITHKEMKKIFKKKNREVLKILKDKYIFLHFVFVIFCRTTFIFKYFTNCNIKKLKETLIFQ